jgi:hypothetical protein
MEKLLEELIERLEEKKQGIISQLKNNPVNANDKISLLLSGEALAYDACIKELQRLVEYAHAGKSRSASAF